MFCKVGCIFEIVAQMRFIIVFIANEIGFGGFSPSDILIGNYDGLFEGFTGELLFKQLTPLKAIKESTATGYSNTYGRYFMDIYGVFCAL